MPPSGHEAPAPSGFDAPQPAPVYEPPPAVVSGFDADQMSPMSPGQDRASFPSNEITDNLSIPESAKTSLPEAGADLLEHHPLGNL